MTEGDVVEKNEVLMDLAHVAHVRYDSYRILRGEEHDREILADAGQTGAIRLDDADGSCLEEVLPDHAVGHALPDGDRHRLDGAR